MVITGTVYVDPPGHCHFRANREIPTIPTRTGSVGIPHFLWNDNRNDKCCDSCIHILLLLRLDADQVDGVGI